MKKYIGLLLAFTLVACTSIGLTALNASTSFSDNKIYSNIPYGHEKWQHLDIYVPKHAAGERLDVVVFFYGGSWQTGTKEDYAFVGTTLANNHFIAVIPDYLKYPQARFPAFMYDAAKAVAWTKDHIKAYDGNANRIDVMGHSAGAHIGALLTTDERYLKAEGKNRKDVIKRFVGLSGPYDFTPTDPTLQKIFAPPSSYSHMQATHFIDGSEPPMLLLWGAADKDVYRSNLDKFTAGLKAKHLCYNAIVYPGVDHIGTIVGLSWARKDKSPILDDSIRFLRGQMACNR